MPPREDSRYDPMYQPIGDPNQNYNRSEVPHSSRGQSRSIPSTAHPNVGSNPSTSTPYDRGYYQGNYDPSNYRQSNPYDSGHRQEGYPVDNRSERASRAPSLENIHEAVMEPGLAYYPPESTPPREPASYPSQWEERPPHQQQSGPHWNSVEFQRQHKKEKQKEERRQMYEAQAQVRQAKVENWSQQQYTASAAKTGKSYENPPVWNPPNDPKDPTKKTRKPRKK